LIADSEEYDMKAELQRYLRDVQDHAIRVVERVDSFRELLQNILSVSLTLVGSPRTRRSKPSPKRA